MTRRRFTLRSSHLLMWSSPLLLLVLVFTLNSRPLHHVRVAGPTSLTTTRTATTTSRTATTPATTVPVSSPPVTTTPVTTTPVTTTPVTPPKPSSRPATSTTLVPTVTTTNHDATTTSGSSPNSSASTATTAGVTGSSGGANRAGDLSLSSPDAVVPLRGPGEWSVVATHPVTTELLCAGHSSAVNSPVRLATNQSCQLAITVATGAPTSWILHTLR